MHLTIAANPSEQRGFFLSAASAFEGIQVLKDKSVTGVTASQIPADLLFSRDFWRQIYAILAEEAHLSLEHNLTEEQHQQILLSNAKLAGFPSSSLQLANGVLKGKKPKKQAAGLLKKPVQK